MADLAPPIPRWLEQRPTVGGLIVPWITPQTSDGRYLFGVVDQGIADRALLHQVCGVCGRHLGDRQILLMRLSDLQRQCTNEPALDPVCANYTISACPMIDGRLRTYRGTPARIDDEAIRSPGSTARLGAPAEPWFAVWLREYRLIQDHGHLAASYAGIEPLRIRPVTWRFLGI